MLELDRITFGYEAAGTVGKTTLVHLAAGRLEPQIDCDQAGTRATMRENPR